MRRKDYRPEPSDWALARNRFNTIVYATLRCKTTGVEFGAGVDTREYRTPDDE